MNLAIAEPPIPNIKVKPSKAESTFPIQLIVWDTFSPIEPLFLIKFESSCLTDLVEKIEDLFTNINLGFFVMLLNRT